MMVYLNGRLVRESQARIPVNDHGFMYGDGVYETIRVYGGEMFHFAEHDRRLRASARGLGLRVPYARAVLERTSRGAAGLERLVADGPGRTRGVLAGRYRVISCWPCCRRLNG